MITLRSAEQQVKDAEPKGTKNCQNPSNHNLGNKPIPFPPFMMFLGCFGYFSGEGSIGRLKINKNHRDHRPPSTSQINLHQATLSQLP